MMKYIYSLLFILITSITYGGTIVEKTSMSYLGAFRVPKGSLGGASSVNARTLANGETMQPIAFNPARNSLIMLSYPVDKLVVEVSIPELVKSSNLEDLNTATVIQVPVDPTGGNWDKVRLDGTTAGPDNEGPSGGLPGGLMVYNNKLIGTSWLYYDGSGDNSWRSHFTSSINWVADGINFAGLSVVGTRLIYPSMANGGFVGGYMTKIPSAWQSALGGTALTGLARIPIASRSSFGPSIWAFDPDMLGTTITTPATALVAYPEEHKTLGDYSDVPSLYFNRSGGYGGIVFPEGSDSILVFGHHGLGPKLTPEGVPESPDASCYGAGTSSKDEAKANSWLVANSPNGYACGLSELTANQISSGAACCFDPVDPGTYGSHALDFKVGEGQSCYGYGTSNVSQVRSSSWLKSNSPSSWACGTHTLTSSDISADSACCLDSPTSTTSGDKGGKSYPYVYQIWKYDANDLAKVKNGALNQATGQPYKPWDIVPSVINFDLPFSPEVKAIIGATYDPATQRIYLAQFNGDGEYSLIHAFKLSLQSGKRYRYLSIIDN